MRNVWICDRCGTMHANYVNKCIICEDLELKADARQITFEEALRLYKTSKTKIIISK